MNSAQFSFIYITSITTQVKMKWKDFCVNDGVKKNKGKKRISRVTSQV